MKKTPKNIHQDVHQPTYPNTHHKRPPLTASPVHLGEDSYPTWAAAFGAELAALSTLGPTDVDAETALASAHAIGEALSLGMPLETAATALWAVRTENLDRLPAFVDGSTFDIETALADALADISDRDREGRDA